MFSQFVPLPLSCGRTLERSRACLGPFRLVALGIKLPPFLSDHADADEVDGEGLRDELGVGPVFHQKLLQVTESSCFIHRPSLDEAQRPRSSSAEGEPRLKCADSGKQQGPCTVCEFGDRKSFRPGAVTPRKAALLHIRV
jgi:hypothetical protein